MSLNVMYSSNDRLICDSVQGVVRGALDEHGSALVLVPDFRAQLVASRELAAAGLGFGDIAKTTVLLADIADFGAMNAVYAEYFPDDKPARVCYQVAALPRGARVEIDATAGR